MNEYSFGTDVGLAQRSKLLLRGPDGNYHRLMGYSVSVPPPPDCRGSIKAATDKMYTNGQSWAPIKFNLLNQAHSADL